jgi:peptidoglycan/xylan/chitin deacetylase (PgdA/CDA1 family)
MRQVRKSSSARGAPFRKSKPGFGVLRASIVGIAALSLLSVQVEATAGAATGPPPVKPAPVKSTAISLTFDDGNADQMAALPILAKYGMKGTFYIITGVVGAPNYLTRANLQTIAAAGHEIAGHTVSHPDLTTVPAAEVQRQVCNGRATLASWGYPTTSFAYPYASLNTSVEAIVKACGYNSARGLGDIASAHGCAGCGASESVPPKDPYALRALDEIDTTWTLAQMQKAVTSAEAKGGWVPFTFHHICNGTGCDSLSISTTTLDQFLAWLAKRTSAGTVVKTVQQVVGGTVKPIVTAPASTNTTLPNPSLETLTNGGLFPDCFMPAGFGSNTATWTRTSDTHTGSFAERLDVTNYVDGDAKLLPTFDLGSCTPAATAGKTYTTSLWYKSTGITQFALYYRTSAGFWSYWTSGPWLAPAADWTLATFTTPAAPADTVGISFGLALIANGSVTTDDYAVATSAPVTASAVTAAAVGAPQLVSSVKSKPGKAHAWSKHAKPQVPTSGHGRVIAPPSLDD